MGGCGLSREPSHKTATPLRRKQRTTGSCGAPASQSIWGHFKKTNYSNSDSLERKYCWEACWEDSDCFEKSQQDFFFPWNKINILLSLNCYQVCNASSSAGRPTHMEKTHSTKCQMHDYLVLFSVVISTRWFYIWPCFVKHQKFSFKYIYIFLNSHFTALDCIFLWYILVKSSFSPSIESFP